MEKVALAIVGIGSGKSVGLGVHKVLNALIRLKVLLAVGEVTDGVDKRKGVGGVAMRVPVSVGSAAVGHEDGDLMKTFRRQ